MADSDAPDRWEQLKRCPDCGSDMQRDLAVGERLGLFYICPEHGRFRFSWDANRLERDGEVPKPGK
jgi:hypothetical protein